MIRRPLSKVALIVLQLALVALPWTCTLASTLYLPVANTHVTSAFGERVHPITGRVDYHSGVDLAANNNQPVRAVLDGVVIQAGPRGLLGNSVEIKHAKYNASTIYGHLNTVSVAVGQKIQRGYLIGLAGSTGRSTGPHVHFTVKQLSSGGDIEPLAFLAKLHLDAPASAIDQANLIASASIAQSNSSAVRSGSHQSVAARVARSSSARGLLVASRAGNTVQARMQAKLATAAAKRQLAIAQAQAAKNQKAMQLAALKSAVQRAHNEIARNESALALAQTKLNDQKRDAAKFAFLYKEGAVSRVDAEKHLQTAAAQEKEVAGLSQKVAQGKASLKSTTSLMVSKNDREREERSQS
jgi:hypothetical protein